MSSPLWPIRADDEYGEPAGFHLGAYPLDKDHWIEGFNSRDEAYADSPAPASGDRTC